MDWRSTSGPASWVTRSVASTEIDQLRAEWRGRLNDEAATIGIDDVARVVADWTGVPVSNLTERERRVCWGWSRASQSASSASATP